MSCPDGFWGEACDQPVRSCNPAGGGIDLVPSQCVMSSVQPAPITLTKNAWQIEFYRYTFSGPGFDGNYNPSLLNGGGSDNSVDTTNIVVGTFNPLTFRFTYDGDAGSDDGYDLSSKDFSKSYIKITTTFTMPKTSEVSFGCRTGENADVLLNDQLILQCTDDYQIVNRGTLAAGSYTIEVYHYYMDQNNLLDFGVENWDEGESNPYHCSKLLDDDFSTAGATYRGAARFTPLDTVQAMLFTLGKTEVSRVLLHKFDLPRVDQEMGGVALTLVSLEDNSLVTAISTQGAAAVPPGNVVASVSLPAGSDPYFSWFISDEGVEATHLIIEHENYPEGMSSPGLALSKLNVFSPDCESGAAACSNRGMEAYDGSCICHHSSGPSCEDCDPGFVGPFCTYSDARNCNSNGSVQSDKTCICVDPFVGDQCQDNGRELCSNRGMTDQTGFTCECEPTYAGILNRDTMELGCRFSDAETCNGAGTVQHSGNCAPCFATFAGSNCQYSDEVDCSGRGQVDDDGICSNCVDDWVGPQCEFSDSATCNSSGTAHYNGTCTCFPTFAGETCEYSDEITCNGNGLVQDDGSCICDEGFADSTNCAACKADYYSPANGCVFCTEEYCGGPTRYTSCNTQTGACICKDGFTGVTCNDGIIDCELGQWGEWSECSHACGDNGLRSRSRVIAVQPENGGFECDLVANPLDEDGPCNREECGPTCTWNLWTNWSCCDTSADNSTRTRTKNPGDPDCDGENNELRQCEFLPDEDFCPINCELSEWTEFFDCFPDCNNFEEVRMRNRTREVAIPAQYGGIDCPGALIEEEACVDNRCPIDCVASEWTEWTRCDLNCGGGLQNRTRTFSEPEFGGVDCVGDLSEEQACNVDPCPIDAEWEWGDYTDCSEECGGGVSSRVQVLLVPAEHGGSLNGYDDDLVEEVPCNSQPCPIDCVFHWGQWSPCDEDCGGGSSRRLITIDVQPQYQGELCPSEFVQEVTCNPQECPIDCQWDLWTGWGPCTLLDARNRTRNVLVEGQFGGIDCATEEDIQYRACTYCDELTITDEETNGCMYNQYCQTEDSLCVDCPYGRVANPTVTGCAEVVICMANFDDVVNGTDVHPIEDPTLCMDDTICITTNDTELSYCLACENPSQLPDLERNTCIDCQCEPVNGVCNVTSVTEGGVCQSCVSDLRAGPLCTIDCPEKCTNCDSGPNGSGFCRGEGSFCSDGYWGPSCDQCEIEQCDKITGERTDISIAGLPYGESVGVIAGIAVVCVILLVLAAYLVVVLVRRAKKSNTYVYSLPEEVLYHVDPEKAKGWEEFGEDATKRTEVLEGTEVHRKVMNLYQHSLNGAEIPLKRIWAINNTGLVQNFDRYRETLRSRMETDPILFNSRKWDKTRNKKTLELREWTDAQLHHKEDSFSWNAPDDTVPIIPVVHGTSIDVGWKIAQNGFTSLSLLDSGFYGQGMYFTTSSLYTLPYFSIKENPVIILCFAIPGNAYPVTEHRNDKNSLVGAALKPGHQSHYVLTQRVRPFRTPVLSSTSVSDLSLD
eukprot:TRINITY_DN2696_c0_g1_i2.p1 TRINITY_DN2696_c0_g1~~TRINITY_DN2696_c0_g1_i2.p1  ORF type:complete len:1527 (-),score=193.27 TRINITY_DN2696_c0_g1_i2:46-4626(-)